MTNNFKIIITVFLILFSINTFSQKDSTRNELSLYTKGYNQSYKEGKRQLFVNIFRTAYMPPPVIVYFSVNWYSHTNSQLNSIANSKFSDAVSSANALGISNFSFEFDWYFTDFSTLKWGISFIGLERNTYLTQLTYSNYVDNFAHTDKDAENYYKYIYGNNINENIRLVSYTTPISGNLKFSIIEKLIECELKVGVKIHLYNTLKINYKGTYTYHGVYERYGGKQLPLHDIERYGFYTNYNLEDKISSQRIKTKLPFQPFFSIGFTYLLSPLKIGFSLDWVNKMAYQQNTNMDEYYLSQNIDDHHTVFQTREITGKSDIYIKLKLYYHITNQSNVEKYYKYKDK